MLASSLGPTIFELVRGEGKAEGLKLSLLTFLGSRFTTIPESLEQQIASVTHVDQLEQAIKSAATCQSVEDFQI